MASVGDTTSNVPCITAWVAAGTVDKQGYDYWLMYQPPLGERTWPVTNFASSDAR